MLIGQEDVELPVFDTTRIHAAAAMEFALALRPCLPKCRIGGSTFSAGAKGPVLPALHYNSVTAALAVTSS